MAVLMVVLLIIYYAKMKQTILGSITGNYFTDDELTHSDTADRLGLDNTPSSSTLRKLHALRDAVLNPARKKLGSFIRVNCAYRSPAVNSAVGGTSNSQHLTGEAADITAGSIPRNRELFRILVSLGNYDQLIWEKGGQWIHVSYKIGSGRKQLLAYDGKKYTNITNNWEGAIA